MARCHRSPPPPHETRRRRPRRSRSHRRRRPGEPVPSRAVRVRHLTPHQQHGSVYWSDTAESALASLDPARPLVDLAPRAFALPNAPIWQDSSTTKDCALLEAAIGGPQPLADLSGSRAYKRFTGPQIARVRVLSSSLTHASLPPAHRSAGSNQMPTRAQPAFRWSPRSSRPSSLAASPPSRYLMPAA